MYKRQVAREKAEDAAYKAFKLGHGGREWTAKEASEWYEKWELEMIEKEETALARNEREAAERVASAEREAAKKDAVSTPSNALAEAEQSVSKRLRKHHKRNGHPKRDKLREKGKKFLDESIDNVKWGVAITALTKLLPDEPPPELRDEPPPELRDEPPPELQELPVDPETRPTTGTGDRKRPELQEDADFGILRRHVQTETYEYPILPAAALFAAAALVSARS